MDIAVRKGRDVLLVGLAYGIVVVEIGVAVDEDVVDSGTEQTGDPEIEEARDFVGYEGEEAVDEEQDNDEPLEHGIYQEMWELSHVFLHVAQQ